MQSSFQFTNPSLDKLIYEVNSDFVLANNDKVEIEINSSVSIEKKEGSNEAVVSLNLTVGSQSVKSPFFINAVESAHFRWDEESVDGVGVDTLLNKNAVALLISYLRPTISLITAASNYPAYHLPFLNLYGSKQE